MDDLIPFSQIPLHKYFQHDLEKIKMAFRLSDTILKDLKNIRAAGEEVEFAVKDFFAEKLFPKYHVCDGHIVDSTLKASPQFDIIICENSKNPVLYNLADKSEILFYETVYCFGEVKKSFYDKKLLEDFSKNIKRTKLELKREIIPPNFIECSNSGIRIEERLTDLPYRNVLLTFMFFVETKTVNYSHLREFIHTTENKDMPNFIVFLDAGLIVNVNKKEFEKNKIKINLYPEFEEEENIWVMMNLPNENDTLTYQYLLIIEHLNNTVLSIPDLKNYVRKLFDFSILNFHQI
ncbi:MAG: DUF6602 domain-containing protein [Ginsengibacter sp.]